MAVILEQGYSKPEEQTIYEILKSKWSRIMSEQPYLQNGQRVLGSLLTGVSDNHLLVGGFKKEVILFKSDTRKELSDKVYLNGESGPKFSSKVNIMPSYGKMFQRFYEISNRYHKTEADSNNLHSMSVAYGSGSSNPTISLNEQ